MRLRNIAGSDEILASCQYVISNPIQYKGLWNTLFNNNNDIHIEVGMGKGQFITALAKSNPHVNYIGIEMYSSVLIRAISKLETFGDLAPSNLRFLCIDAKTLTEVFEQNEIRQIYLNFSDPWPKDRHAKRRLTSPNFMKLYDCILAANGHIEFKTDNRLLFDYSLEAIPASGWTISKSTFDLHNDTKMNEGNIMTEYEEKFSSIGNPICKLIAKR